MKRDNVNYLLVGIFVVVMAIGFFVLLVAVTGRSGPTDSYFVEYNNVSGLKFGTGVFYEGYRVGQIEEITPVANASGMQYRIELSVAAGWKIPADSIAKVAASGLISAVTIQIQEGQADTFLNPGDNITGVGQSDLFSVLNQAADDFRVLSRDGIMPVLSNVNQQVTVLSDEILRFRREDLTPFVRMMHRRVDEDLLEGTMSVLERLERTAANLEEILSDSNQQRISSFLTHIDGAALNLNELVQRIEQTRLQMNGVLASIGELVTENQNEVSGTVAAAQTSMQELELSVKTLNQHLGAILQNVESGSRHMGEFARSIRDNPARLIRNSKAVEPGQ